MSDEKVFCATCGAECIPEGCTTGYGQDREGRKHCFACCADRERASMVETGRAVLYLVEREEKGRWSVQDWAGRLRFACIGARDGKHNIAGTRIDVWYIGPDGWHWHGVSYGKNTQIVHCKRTRSPGVVNDPLTNVALEKARIAC